jgi:hypothetical protein
LMLSYTAGAWSLGTCSISSHANFCRHISVKQTSCIVVKRFPNIVRDTAHV